MDAKYSNTTNHGRYEQGRVHKRNITPVSRSNNVVNVGLGGDEGRMELVTRNEQAKHQIE